MSQHRSTNTLAVLDGLRRHVRVTVEGMLAVAILGQIGYSSLSIVRATTQKEPKTANVVTTSGQAPHRLAAAAQALTEAHLFGAAPSAQIPDTVAEAPAAWVLTGTLAEQSVSSGSAILGATQQHTRLFAVGQQVLTGYELAEVFWDRVTLRHSGELITLRLKKQLSEATLTAQAARAARPDGSPASLATEAPERPQNWVLAREVLQPSPYLDAAGHYSGIQLQGSAKNNRLTKYGLRSDDVITGVNGRELTSWTIAEKALREMSQGAPSLITVMRDGAVRQISLTLVDDGSL
jgi:type II secretory pathway component PulC